MTYELAEQLKDAGFPQHYDMNVAYAGIPPPYFPTLSELIEALPKGIFNLLRQSQFHKQETEFEWETTFADVEKITVLTLPELDRVMIRTYGHTAEEAVANLWLVLNKK